MKAGDRVFELDRDWLAHGALIYRERRKDAPPVVKVPPQSNFILKVEVSAAPPKPSAHPQPATSPVTLTLGRKDGTTEPFVFRVDESGNLPLRVERVELKNGFGGWAIGYAAKAPSKAGVLRVYRRVGEALVYREG